MVRLPIPAVAYQDVNYTLSGEKYIFTYRFNEIMNEGKGRWQVDIRDTNDVYQIKGLTLIEGTAPTLHLENVLPQGFLYVVQLDKDEEPAGRYNLGIGKSYELHYITYSELDS